MFFRSVWSVEGGGSVRTVSRIGVCDEKPGYDECKCSHEVIGERALQRGGMMKMKPSDGGMVE